MSYNSQPNDREQFQGLNNRLATFLQNLKDAQAGGADPATLKDLIKRLESEIDRQKQFYEREIDSLRNKLSDSERARNNSENQKEALERDLTNCKSRYNDEVGKNGKLMADIDYANKRIAELEAQLAETKANAKANQDRAAQNQDDVGAAMQKYDQANQELAREKGRNKDLQSQLNEALQKQDFNKRSSNEQQKENQNRLDNAKRLVADLERKNKELEKKCGQLPQQLAEAAKKNAEEMKAYKDQSDYANNKNMEDLRRQYNALSRQIDDLRAENAKLQQDNDDLKKWFKAMEQRAAELQAQKEALEQQMKAEREKNNNNLRDCEKRLKELNDLVNEKVKESNDSRDLQASMRQELNTYKQLLDGEDGKIGQRCPSRGGRNNNMYGPGGRSGGLGSAQSGRNGLGSSQGRTGGGFGGSQSGSRPMSQSMKIPQRSLITEYMDEYKRKAGYSQGGMRSRRTELPRVG